MKHKLFLFTFLLAILSAINIQASERKKYNFNSEWKLRIGDFPKAKDTKFDDSKWKQVTLPHAFNEDEAFKLSIEQLTDTVVWYRKSFQIPELKSNQKVFVEFEGVRQRGDFYLNGHYLGRHENGVMAVGFDLTPHIKEGENVIAVRTDNDWMYREEGTNSKFQWKSVCIQCFFKNRHIEVAGTQHERNLITQASCIHIDEFADNIIIRHFHDSRNA